MTAPQHGRLTVGQLDALRLAANGFTSRQIAARLGTTEHGIDLRLRYATQVLGANSRTHAVAVAIARGLIRVDEIAPTRQREGQEGAQAPASRP